MKKIIIVILCTFSSCTLVSKEECKSILIESESQLDSIQSGLEINSGIYNVKLEIDGHLSEPIDFWGITLNSGKVDTVIGPSDYYSPDFVYLIKNPNNGKGNLDICVTFYH